MTKSPKKPEGMDDKTWDAAVRLGTPEGREGLYSTDEKGFNTSTLVAIVASATVTHAFLGAGAPIDMEPAFWSFVKRCERELDRRVP